MHSIDASGGGSIGAVSLSTTPLAPDKSFEKNVRKLFRRTSLPSQLGDKLLKIWERRDDFHHLNPSIPTDRRVLAKLAKQKTQLLAEVQREVFHVMIDNGKATPKYPKYWDITGDSMSAYINLEP